MSWSNYQFGQKQNSQTDWKNTNLPPITKNSYKPLPAVQSRKPNDVERWYQDNEVTVKEGDNVPNPVITFDESTFPESVQTQLCKNYEKPTVIQSITWPVALSGKDVISIAKTGSGKTLGFILPGIIHVKNQPPRQTREGPIVVVLLPTRELALQVLEVAQEYCRVTRLTVTCCYGGASKGAQSRELMSGVDICIATPGRLLDFLDSRVTTMLRCSYFVLDEADRMLDMGFEPQIRRIAEQIRPDRQTLMFSATWPRDVRKLAADFHTDPVHLNVGSLDLAANHNIQQNVEVVEEYDKAAKLFQLLDEILSKDDKSKILIFVATKRKADELTRGMRKDGWPALCIHGDKEQPEREWVLKEFKESKTPILIATDVAARGLDVDDIKFVINYDYPNNSEDYVHRIGRTGRRDRIGVAITFFTNENGPKARDLIKVLEEAKQKVPADLASMANGSFPASMNGFRSRGPRGGYGGGGGGFTGANNYPVNPRSGDRKSVV